MVLAEGIAPDQSTTSEKLLVDLGVSLPRLGNHNIPRKAPHEKYYWSQWITSFKYTLPSFIPFSFHRSSIYSSYLLFNPWIHIKSINIKSKNLLINLFSYLSCSQMNKIKIKNWKDSTITEIPKQLIGKTRWFKNLFKTMIRIIFLKIILRRKLHWHFVREDLLNL